MNPKPAQPKAVLDDRSDPPHPTDQGEWLEPYDGDTAAERDQWWHVDRNEREDW